MALIELRGVARRYTLGDIEVRALDGIHLAIEAGEFVAIMGQSGSGKSTLMNVLGCLDNPTEAQVPLDGQDAGQLGPDELAGLRRERFGFIFQRYHLLPHLDARANAALPAVYAGVGHGPRSSRAQALLDAWAWATGCTTSPTNCRAAEQQRVSIARALMNGGQIILADEPTGALDSASGAEMLRLLKELNAAGHTVILVTHDPTVAAHDVASSSCATAVSSRTTAHRPGTTRPCCPPQRLPVHQGLAAPAAGAMARGPGNRLAFAAGQSLAYLLVDAGHQHRHCVGGQHRGADQRRTQHF